MSFILTYIYILSRVLIYTIVAWSLLSWFPIRWDNPALVIARHITQPLLSPLRRLKLRLGVIDLTPLIAVLILIAIPYVLSLLISWFFRHCLETYAVNSLAGYPKIRLTGTSSNWYFHRSWRPDASGSGQGSVWDSPLNNPFFVHNLIKTVISIMNILDELARIISMLFPI